MAAATVLTRGFNLDRHGNDDSGGDVDQSTVASEQTRGLKRLAPTFCTHQPLQETFAPRAILTVKDPSRTASRTTEVCPNTLSPKHLNP